jgi:Lysylphosphatidylglycerol synthase TM region
MNRPVSVVLAVAVTGVCLWFLLTPEALHSLRRMGTDAKPLPVVAAFLFCTLVQWLRAWRYSMMTAARLNLPDNAMVRIACQANFLNFALPFRLGELGYPVLMQRRYGIRFLHATGVLLLARLFDLAAVGCIFLASAWALGMMPGIFNLIAAAGAVALAVAPFGVALAGQALRPHLVRLPYVGATIAEPLSAALDALGDMRVRLAVVAVGFAIWLALALMAVLTAQAVVDTVPAAAAVLGGAASSLAFALPINGIAGIGPTQAAWVAATVQTGVPWDDAVVSALALHAVVLVNAIVLGGLAMLPWPGDAAAK